MDEETALGRLVVTGVTVPQYGVEGKHAVLYCRSNYLQSIKVNQRNTGTSTNKYSCLRGSISIVCLFSYYSETPVYSVRWYKNGKEFYR